MDQWTLALGVMTLLAGGCSGGMRNAAGNDWMDSATVVVAQDAIRARETVTLVDRSSGMKEVMDDEPLRPDVSELFEP